jgi:hypothetical protein
MSVETTGLIGIGVVVLLQIVSNITGLRSENRLTKLETQMSFVLRLLNGGKTEIEGE